MNEKRGIDLSFVTELYDDSLKRYGTSPRGVGWPSEDSHALRHEMLTRVIASDAEPFSVNDLGCGYGSFYEYLKSRGLPLALFRGYDISKKMLAEARRRIRSADVEFVQASSLDQAADYSVASGIFNVRNQVSDNEWCRYILDTLTNLNEFSMKGFAFNMLSTYVEWRKDQLFYGDPCFFFDHCKRNYSRQVSLFHDYPLWEWTIAVRK